MHHGLLLLHHGLLLLHHGLLLLHHGLLLLHHGLLLLHHRGRRSVRGGGHPIRHSHAIGHSHALLLLGRSSADGVAQSLARADHHGPHDGGSAVGGRSAQDAGPRRRRRPHLGQGRVGVGVPDRLLLLLPVVAVGGGGEGILLLDRGGDVVEVDEGLEGRPDVAGGRGGSGRGLDRRGAVGLGDGSGGSRGGLRRVLLLLLGRGLRVLLLLLGRRLRILLGRRGLLLLLRELGLLLLRVPGLGLGGRRRPPGTTSLTPVRSQDVGGHVVEGGGAGGEGIVRGGGRGGVVLLLLLLLGRGPVVGVGLLLGGLGRNHGARGGGGGRGVGGGRAGEVGRPPAAVGRVGGGGVRLPPQAHGCDGLGAAKVEQVAVVPARGCRYGGGSPHGPPEVVAGLLEAGRDGPGQVGVLLLAVGGGALDVAALVQVVVPASSSSSSRPSGLPPAPVPPDGPAGRSLPPLYSARPPLAGSLDPQFEHLGHLEEGLAVDEEIVLAEAGGGRHGGGGVGHDLEDVVAPHGPGVLELGPPRHGVVHLLAVGQDQLLARGDRPDDGHVVLLPSARRAGLAGLEGVPVGESEAPAF